MSTALRCSKIKDLALLRANCQQALADFDKCYAQFLSFTHEVATFTPHPDWLGTKLEDCLNPDDDDKQSFYYDWLRAEIYFQGKRRSLSAEAAENEEIRKTEIETLLEEIATFWDKKDENIKKGLACMHQNSSIFSPVNQLLLFVGTWIACLDTGRLGKRFDSYRKSGCVTAYRFEQLSWGLLCTVEVSPQLIHTEHSDSVIKPPVTFVGEFELARECTHLRNVVFKCYGIEEDKKGFESVFSTFTSEEIKSALKLLKQTPELPTPSISGSILSQRIERLARHTESEDIQSISFS